MKRSLLIGAAALLCGASAMAATSFPSRTDFRDESIYFAMTTRFYDGDISNNTYCWDGVKNVNDPEWRGDFKGLIEKLDYIKALGFTAVWITPVVENGSGLDYHGYHAMNFQKVDPRYESEDCKFQDLIDAVHARGMKIILDVVLQHNGNFGEEYLCPMFQKDYTQPLDNINKSMKRHPQSKLPANYDALIPNAQYQARLTLMKNNDNSGKDPENYWHHVGQSWDWDDYSRVWGQIAGDCVDLNTENPHVYNYITKCYSKFIEMGVDGFRVDTSGHIARVTFNKAFLPKFKAAGEAAKAKRGGTPFYMFGEVCARAEEVIYRDQNYNCSPCFYTWAEDKDYAWDEDENSWKGLTFSEVAPSAYSVHPNTAAVLAQAADYQGHSDAILQKSNNAWLNGNDYHTPDYSKSSGFNVIDFPMHWRFSSAKKAFNVNSQDNLYNDATWNVVYVDGHDYGPNGWNTKSFGGSEAEWAENYSLMFTFRGIPCIWQGSECYFQKGVVIDEGPHQALKNTARAYFGGYLTGSVNTTDFAEYTGATGNLAATLSHPLAMHLQRLNKIRAAVPCLRKGQYSTDGCSGNIAFKRRYVDASTDSYALIAISGDASFSNILNGTYTDVITGDVKKVTNGSLSVSCSGQGNLRIYVLSTAKTPAPGKIGTDGKYLYASAPATQTQLPYDGQQEAPETVTQRDDSPGPGPQPEPDDPKPLVVYKDETCAFFHNTSGWGGNIYAWCWNDKDNYTGGTWPGTVCEYLGNGYWKWSYGSKEIPEAGTYIIFNASGSQTANLTFQNGAVYAADGTVEQVIPEGEEVNPDPQPDPDPDPDPTPDPTESYTVYFDNGPTTWATVNIHYWGGESASSWPGVKMTLCPGSSSVYYYVVPAGTTGLVFNNGGGSQTGDLTALPNHIYSINGDQGEHSDTGIGGVGVDATAPIYYNMQGIRVLNPSDGIYIVRRGNVVTKEYVR